MIHAASRTLLAGLVLLFFVAVPHGIAGPDFHTWDVLPQAANLLFSKDKVLLITTGPGHLDYIDGQLNYYVLSSGSELMAEVSEKQAKSFYRTPTPPLGYVLERQIGGGTIATLTTSG